MNTNNNALSMLQQYSDSEDDMENTNKTYLDNIPTTNTCTTPVVGIMTGLVHTNEKEPIKDIQPTSPTEIQVREDGIIENEVRNRCDIEKKDVVMDTMDKVHKDITNINLPENNDSLQQNTEEDSSDEETPYFLETYRETQASDSETDTSSSDESEESNLVVDLNEDHDDEHPTTESKKNMPKFKMLEDLGFQDLPPIEDLKITVPQEECIPIGKIANIIDLLVIVAANRGTPAVDLDSVLFLDQGQKTLGQVLDVFGPVNEPMYMVRFNSAQHIADKGIEIGMPVYFAPRTKHTSYVFLDSLLKLRGSDASWENDTEPPEGCLDYSDDEEERKAKLAMKAKKLQTQESSGENSSATLSQRRKRNKFKSNTRQFQSPGQYPSQNPFYMRGPPPPSSVYNPYPPHNVFYPPPSAIQGPPAMPNRWLPPPPPNWQPYPQPYPYPTFGGPPHFPQQ